jgi:hypothetical protein
MSETSSEREKEYREKMNKKSQLRKYETGNRGIETSHRRENVNKNT